MNKIFDEIRNMNCSCIYSLNDNQTAETTCYKTKIVANGYSTTKKSWIVSFTDWLLNDSRIN